MNRILGLMLLTTAAHATPNPIWPPSSGTAIPDLKDPKHWPSDAAYAYGYAPASGAGEKSGQWWLYSFVPDRATNAVVLHEPGLPAGLSVDSAWRTTTGSPEVVLAVLDDGVDIANPDLLEAIYLNLGELRQQPPTHADGSPCAPLSPTDPLSPLVDCSEPPDGAFTISDYRETLGWTNGSNGIDPNGNGVLDPGDLLLLGFADKIDNDENGFVDDIVGWDFVDLDNQPVPVQISAGTEAALDAAARANNDFDRAGVCPNCRILPVRVGFQRGTSSQAIALGVLYASSFGATAALVGHVPQGRTRILDSALRSAGQRGMLTLFPRDGEQQLSPPIRFDSAGAQMVGSVTQLNNWTMTTGSFVAQDPCQTHELEPTLLAAAPACSRRGPAVALGIAGLTASVSGPKSNPTKLSAFELSAVLNHSAETIRPADTSASPVQATSSLRRMNAQTAVSQVATLAIPPEIELDTPHWFETVELDSLTLRLDVVGRVAALRAGTYDIFVELAPGMSPKPSDFTVISESHDIAGATITGPSATLGRIDLWEWSKSQNLANAGDSTRGFIATLRVRVVAHSQSSSDAPQTIENQVTRQIVLVEDTSLISGFPFRLDAAPTDPQIVDLNGDGFQEIVVGTIDGRLLALNVKSGSPTDLFKGTVATALLPPFQRFRTASNSSQAHAIPPMFAGTTPIGLEYGAEPVAGAAAVADLDGDGILETVFAGATGRVYVVEPDGTQLPGWPRCIQGNAGTDCQSPNAIGVGISAAPVLGDIDGDGHPEIIVGSNVAELHAFHGDGTSVAGWPIAVHTVEGTATGPFAKSPAVADMDGDQIEDLVLTANPPKESSNTDASLSVVILGAAPPSGPTVAPSWPTAIMSYDFEVDRQLRQSPAAAVDVSSPEPRALLYGNATPPFFLTVRTGGASDNSALPRHAEPVQADGETRGFALLDRGPDSTLVDSPAVAPLFARAALADLDRDGETDVVLPATTLGTLDLLRSPDKSEHRGLLAFWSGRSGKMLAASPIELGDFVGAVTPAVADLNGDGYPEMILPSGTGTLVAYDACGRSPKGWPKLLGGNMSRSPAIGDVDGDGKLDVVAVTDDGRVFAWRTDAPRNAYVSWGSALHDAMNKSAYTPPVDTFPAFPGPIRLDQNGRCVPQPKDTPDINAHDAEMSPRGGCACSTADKQTRFNSSVAMIALLVLGRRRLKGTRCASAWRP